MISDYQNDHFAYCDDKNNGKNSDYVSKENDRNDRRTSCNRK